MGYTQFRKDQDFVKVHLKGKESINKLLEKGGPNKSVAFLNMGIYLSYLYICYFAISYLQNSLDVGDTIESFVIDLEYDGIQSDLSKCNLS